MKLYKFSFHREAVWMLLFPFVSAALGILAVLIVMLVRWLR